MDRRPAVVDDYAVAREAEHLHKGESAVGHQVRHIGSGYAARGTYR